MNILKIKLIPFNLILILLSFTYINEVKSQVISVDGKEVIIQSDDNLKNNIILKRSNIVEPLGSIEVSENFNGSKSWFNIKDRAGNSIFTAREGAHSALAVNGKRYVTAFSDGKVAIADSDYTIIKKSTTGSHINVNDFRLFVQGGILTEKVKCAVKESGDWADYVFEEDYEMMDINDLEGFVTENKHLPNVPSAEEMVENGLDVAKMDAKLLEKIEEAYLYIIDMNKEMKAMNEKVDALANENGELKASLSAISTSGK